MVDNFNIEQKKLEEKKFIYRQQLRELKRSIEEEERLMNLYQQERERINHEKRKIEEAKYEREEQMR